MHRPSDSIGKRWRWNIWAQEFLATRNPAHDKLNDEEWNLVTDFLTRKGYRVDE